MPAPSPRAPRLALRCLQVGALLVALAALRYKLFELDRFFVPKELVLHATAALVAVARLAWPLWRPAPATVTWPTGHALEESVAPAGRVTLVDGMLGLYLVLSLVSAALAQNGWLASRATALSFSAAAVFWGARAVARAGHGRTLLATVAAATVAGAATSLLQAYGAESVYFSVNRAPGGTFGNRNFVAHLAAIGMPLLVGLGLRARRRRGTLAAALGAGSLATVLVLSRSRGAWLAARLRVRTTRRRALAGERLPGTRPPLGRSMLLVLALVGGAAVAIMAPNDLKWKSASPYLDSVKGVVDYRGGSGGGRLKQYANSGRLALAHPMLGVGPGNWAVHYPAFAPAGDPSMTVDGTTANPWPSSDWVAIVSERGLLAALALGGTILGLFWWAHVATWRARDADRALVGGMFGATLTAIVVVGAFDAVLLLAAPAFVAWAALGALAVESGALDESPRPLPWPRGARRLAWGVLAVAGTLGTLRALGQSTAMALFSTGRVGAIATAGGLDPGSYRIRLREAELAAQRGRCADVRTYAGAATAMLPQAPAPKRLLAACRPRRQR